MIKFIPLLFGLLLSIQAASQDYMSVETIGIQDGLSFRDVKDVYRDSQGFMWFCTNDGLNRYDGVNWEIYKHVEGDSTSIPGNTVHWIFEDSDDHLIFDIRNKDRVNSIFDRKERKFRKIIFSNVDEEKNITHIYKPFKTRSGKTIAIGRILTKEENVKRENWKYKYYIFNYLKNGVFEVSHEIEYTKREFIPTTDYGISERYWVKRNGSYQVYDAADKAFLKLYIYSDFGGNRYLPLDSNGNFWYPNRNFDSKKLFDSFQLPTNIPLEDWQDFRIDNYWNIWITNKNGAVYKYDIQRKYLSEESKFNLSYFSGREIFEDNDGTLWLPGTYGVDKVKKKRTYFESYLLHSKTIKSKLRKKGVAVYSIIETSDGKVHALSGYNILHTIDPNLETTISSSKRIAYKNGIRKTKLLSSDVAMLPALNNKVWVRSLKYFHQYNTTTDEIIIYPIPDTLKYDYILNGNWVTNFQMDDSGKLWSTFFDRLYSFDTLSKAYTIQSDKIFVKGIVGIGEGQMWVCSNTTLSKFDSNGNILKEYDTPPLDPFDYEIEIFKVVIYKDKVWIGTRNGLLEFDPKEEQFIPYTTEEGLSHNIIYTIIPDGDYLWMGTHYGLSRFNIITKEFKNYFAHDGLTHNEFNREAAYKAKDGKLYFGGMNGINAFYPEVLDSAARLEPSKIVLTQFSKIDGPLKTLETYPLDQLDDTKPIEIYYGDKSFTFRYALLNFLNPSDNTYSYFLDGFELDWNYAENLSYTNYPILPPGKYVFRVKAKDSLGNPGINELAIPVIVYGPWWSRWWARGLFIILILSSLFLYIRWQTVSLKKQKRELEQTVKERTIELNEQKERAERSEKYKEQFLANMSHEIRTPMHAISGMTNILARNEHPKHQNKFLKVIQQSSRNLLVIINDILDLSKIEAGKIEIEQIPMNLSEVIENVVNILRQGAEEKGLALQATIAREVPEFITGDPTRLNQILLNLVGNAIKFTEKGKVNLDLILVDNKLRFSVKDSGIGIPKDKLKSVFGTFEQVNESTTRKYGGTGLGLSISKQLVELQNGTIWVESEENMGSTFFFELPFILVDEQSKQNILISEEQLKAMAESLTGLNILLVEDNEFNIMVASDDLSYYIKEVKIGLAKNGEVAIQEFETGKYDLILMDIQMPKLNGYEASKAIRKIEATHTTKTHTPIIAMTASLLKTEIEFCYAAGMDNYIPKPYKIEELISAIYTEIKKPKP